MRLRKKIMVLGHKITTKRLKRDPKNWWGEADVVRGTTTVFKHPFSESTRTEIFWHETVHHINQIMGLGLTEAQVRGVSTGSFAVIRDNNLDLRKPKERKCQRGTK